MLLRILEIQADDLDHLMSQSSRVDCFPCVKLGSSRDRSFASRESIVIRFIRSVYAPFLLKRKVKLAVMAIFSGLFVASWICTDYINLGLGGSSFTSTHVSLSD